MYEYVQYVCAERYPLHAAPEDNNLAHAGALERPAAAAEEHD